MNSVDQYLCLIFFWGKINYFDLFCTFKISMLNFYHFISRLILCYAKKVLQIKWQWFVTSDSSLKGVCHEIFDHHFSWLDPIWTPDKQANVCSNVYLSWRVKYRKCSRSGQAGSHGNVVQNILAGWPPSPLSSINNRCVASARDTCMPIAQALLLYSRATFSPSYLLFPLLFPLGSSSNGD